MTKVIAWFSLIDKLEHVNQVSKRPSLLLLDSLLQEVCIQPGRQAYYLQVSHKHLSAGLKRARLTSSDKQTTSVLENFCLGPRIKFFISFSHLVVFSGRAIFPLFPVYGHITLKTPVLVRSLKLSNVEPS